MAKRLWNCSEYWYFINRDSASELQAGQKKTCFIYANVALKSLRAQVLG